MKDRMSIWVYIISFYFASICAADIGIHASQQSNIFPVEKTNIRMEREIVNIDLFYNCIKVHAKFYMYNYGDDEMIRIGFPFYNDGLYKIQQVSDFWYKVNDNGGKVEIENKSDGIFGHELKWYSWKVTFPGKDTTIIEVGYNAEWGKDGFAPIYYFDYIIGTARTWAGSIGHGKIKFNYTELASDLFLMKCWMDTSFQYKPYDYQQNNTTIYEDSIIYEFNNYTPRENEVVAIAFISFWDVGFFSLNKEQLRRIVICQNYTRNDLIRMCSEMMARNGYEFSDQDQDKLFRRKIWYKPGKKIDHPHADRSIHQMDSVLVDIEDEL